MLGTYPYPSTWTTPCLHFIRGWKYQVSLHSAITIFALRDWVVKLVDTSPWLCFSWQGDGDQQAFPAVVFVLSDLHAVWQATPGFPSLGPRLPPFWSLVCVHNNTRNRKIDNKNFRSRVLWVAINSGPEDPRTRGSEDPRTQVPTVFSLGLCCTYCNYNQLVSMF